MTTEDVQANEFVGIDSDWEMLLYLGVLREGECREGVTYITDGNKWGAMYDRRPIIPVMYDIVQEDEYQYGLKPYIYYSCRYKSPSTGSDFIVNYTLDNTITVIGKVYKNSGTSQTEYVTKTGHLIDATNIPDILETENLTETLITIDNPTEQKSYEYVIYGNDKIYKDDVGYFRYATDGQKNYIPSNSGDISNINSLFDNNNSAKKYYDEGIEFTNWAKVALRGITARNAVDIDNTQITFSSDTGANKIFDISASNNPLTSDSVFNEHRMNVIRYSIESNLSAAINSYSEHAATGIEYAMPKIEEDKWEMIENNVCFITFLQGLPIGGKMYNNYCVVANNTNQETVGADSIYIIDSNNEYHKAGCRNLNDAVKAGTVTIKGAYASSDFKRASLSTTGADANAHTQINDFLSASGPSTDVAYYFPQSGCTACYDCIVSASSDTYSIDDVIKEASGINNLVRQRYLTALARCRYNLYTINGYFGY